ncbi:related to SRP40 Suppressor of mutant AC40 of RNA polymerase I and III [Phialocephala subalpina]|uniref:Related to SRP40 Suppressor of mutant AC40 of RNA polymerase I and III n=1 Tax=Phialocephala subalpina TaxID=576137 RepID=A0A1L7X7K2_9HELO|nr:related to SRP40 Suppressor of mutant AC40 of RNA polymerase I and III [Phialocephala subalpina]
MAEAEYTRLHITPFTPALLNTFLPASILPNARNISYHSIQTFPEKGYGYVELPTMDAEKIKKKLNGSILKGTKVRIEKARPEKKVVVEPQEQDPPKREKKKRKRDELPGVDIGERHVKRGWTTPAKDISKSKDKKAINKSKYTSGPECLFKTNLPPNVASKQKSAEVKPEKRKKKRPGKETVVHEFAKTTKYATFLRSSSGSSKTKAAAEYVEGKGWVDEEGNLVEEVITKKKRKAKEPTPEPPAEASKSSSESENSEDEETAGKEADMVEAGPIPRESSQSDAIATNRSDDSEDEQVVLEEVADAMEVDPTLPGLEDAKGDTTSDSSEDDSSSDSESGEVEIDQTAKECPHSSDSSSSDSESSESSEDESEVEDPQSAVTNRSHASTGPALSIKIPISNDSTPINTSVHPLEALYKRPKADATSSSKPAPPSFSFFGADGEEENEEDSFNQVPLTPFTQKDFEYRGIRSAAPTPDTAHPNKRFIWPTDNDDEEDEENDEAGPSSPIQKPEGSEAKDDKEGEPESEFQKWFWENRGNVDRSWKARRRAVAKEKRQRENRKRQDRDV